MEEMKTSGEKPISKFDKFFEKLTLIEKGVCKMHEGTHPNRLQNTSAMLSKGCDFSG